MSPRGYVLPGTSERGDSPRMYPVRKVGRNRTANATAYRVGDCSVLVSVDDGRWHLSIGHPSRYPTWDEVKFARYRLLDADLQMGMFLPPPDSWVNEHDHVFHLWEVRDEWHDEKQAQIAGVRGE